MENYYMVYNNFKKFLAEDWIFLFVGLGFVGGVFVCACVVFCFLVFFPSRLVHQINLIWNSTLISLV